MTDRGAAGARSGPPAAGPVSRWLVLLGLLALALLAGVAFGGAAGVGPLDALRVLFGLPPRHADPALVEPLVWVFRLPRVLIMALAGAALAVTGAALQASLQNSLVDPSLVGVSGGASLGAVLAYTTGLADRWLFSVPLAAFAGALVAVVVVYLIAYAAGRPTTGALLLTGVAVGSLAAALVSVLILATAQHRVHEIFAWLLGSAEGRTWRDVRLAALPVAGGIAGLFLLRRLIDALALGEEHALSIGVDLLRGRAAVFAAVALAAGGAVSVTGPVAFVGLMVPHMVRTWTGPSARTLLPASMLAGAAFLVLADLLGRVVSVTVDLPVGIVTTLMGVPFFLFLLHRARVGRG